MPEQSTSQPSSRIARRLRVLLALLGVLLLVALVVVGVEQGWVDAEALANWLESVSSHWWAPIAFVGIYILINVLMLPGTPLTLVAGVAWGWAEGGLWVMVGSTLGAALPFLIARSGAPAVERLIQKRAGRLYSRLQNEGFITLLLMRLVPIFPYNVLNYASGLSGLRFREYLLATFLGTIPGVFIYTYLADSLKKGLLSPGDAFLRILIAGVLLAGLVIVTRLMSRRVRRRLEK